MSDGRVELNDDILLSVEKPARYIGGEYNSIAKGGEGLLCRIALAFPDLYEIGMSHLGLKILYSLLNERRDVACERVFAPWYDMEEVMRRGSIPLFSLETRTPLKEFDIVGFSLQYELSYTNVLNMLDLAGIPLFSAERQEGDPLIIGGGPCVFNPEPMVDFFDCFLIGDAEEAVIEIVDVFIEAKKRSVKRDELLRRLADIEGAYVPSFSKEVKKRTVLNLEEAYYPVSPPVPYIQIVHDRIQLEIMRGCRRGCKFCQAGLIYRPNRQRSVEKLTSLAGRIYANTGYDEISLVSLSSGDHTEIRNIVLSIKELFKGKGVNISLPSLRVEDMISDFPLEISSGRRTGLTFAPEVGSEKMRRIINKHISPETLKECAYQAFKNGWRTIKLYFMLGLPQEDYSDLEAIVDLAKEIAEAGMRVCGKRAELNASVSVFIPKPHTAFEREAMLPLDEIKKRQDYIRMKARSTRVKFNFHDANMSYIEAVFSRGDRNLSKCIYNAWKRGCRFDGWSDYFNFERWMAAFREEAIDPDYYALRQRAPQENLPWDFIKT